jgi:mono/diheme cytochrome c family protein
VFDLPEAYIPEFPPALFLTTRPDLGDVSKGQLVTLQNFETLFQEVLTPFQLEGMRENSAYFDGDIALAERKGARRFNDREQMAIAHMMNIMDFPPAPKLDNQGRLLRARATEAEVRGEAVFTRNCASCHPAPYYTDNLAHDLAGGALLQERGLHPHGHQGPRRGPHQDVRPARREGLAAVPA